MPFTQIITIEGADEEALQNLVREWHADQAGVAPGYQGARILADGSRHILEVDFSSEEEARQNNDRAETEAWARQLRELADGDPSYIDARPVYSTHA